MIIHGSTVDRMAWSPVLLGAPGLTTRSRDLDDEEHQV